MAKKHVLIDIRPLLSNRVSGVTVYLEGLVKNLALDQSFQYSLFCNSAKRKDFTELEKLIPINYTRYPNKIFNLALAKFNFPKIDKLISKKVDIFISADIRPTALSKNVKKIQVVHDFSWKKYPKYFSKKTNLWFKLIQPQKEINESDAIVTVSKAIKRECGTDRKVRVITPFILRHTKAAEKVKPEAKTLFYIGTLEPRKNLEKAIKAFKIVHKADPKTKFIIAGTRDNSVFSMQNDTSKSSQSKDTGIKYLGNISEKTKNKYLQKSRCLVYLSHYEGFGLPVAEAIINGTPCLISRDPALKETAGTAGLSVNENSVRDIVEGMKKILYDDAGYKELKQNCQKQSKKWNNKQTLQQWVKLLKEF